MAVCCCLTKKKKPCPIDADRIRDGKWYCHVHDPEGQFRQNVKAEQEWRKANRKKQP